MMNDVELDNVVEHVLADEAELAVDSGGGPFEERPGFGFKFWKIGMRVVKIGDGHDPVIDPHVWL